MHIDIYNFQYKCQGALGPQGPEYRLAIILINTNLVDPGGPVDPKFAGSIPAGVDGFFQSVKILSMTSFGRK